MNYKHIITALTVAFTLALTACGGGGGGGSSSSGNNEPAQSVIRANTYDADGNVTGYKLTTTNSAGNPTAETYYDNNGQPRSTIEYTYDGPRLTGTIRRNARGEIIARTSVGSYVGTTRRSNRYAPDDTLLSYVITTTNNAGQTTREDTYAPNGDLREYTTYL